jgi:hypothetical protein
MLMWECFSAQVLDLQREAFYNGEDRGENEVGVTCNVILATKIRCLVPHLSRKREKENQWRGI